MAWGDTGKESPLSEEPVGPWLCAQVGEVSVPPGAQFPQLDSEAGHQAGARISPGAGGRLARLPAPLPWGRRWEAPLLACPPPPTWFDSLALPPRLCWSQKASHSARRSPSLTCPTANAPQARVAWVVRNKCPTHMSGENWPVLTHPSNIETYCRLLISPLTFRGSWRTPHRATCPRPPPG